MGYWNFSPPPPDNEKEKEKKEKEKKEKKSCDDLIWYVVLRRDLIDKWPLGRMLTQIGHASFYAICPNREDPLTIQYCSPENINSIHQVNVKVKGKLEILNLRDKLKSGDMAHELWIDQPGNIPTCLATKPYPRSSLSSYFEKFQVID